MEDPGDPMKTASTTVPAVTVKKSENGPSGWRQRKPISRYAGEIKSQHAAYPSAYNNFPQQNAAPRHSKCSEFGENLPRRKKRRQNDGRSRQIEFSPPVETINLSPSGNSTPPPLHPHAKPVMTANRRVTLTEEGGTADDRRRGIRSELPQLNLLSLSSSTRQQHKNFARCCYHNVYSRFRLSQALCPTSPVVLRLSPFNSNQVYIMI